MGSEVGIRELKNRTSAVVERVENGETITVTRRGKPVARLVPAGIPPGIAKLMREGTLRWTGRKPELIGEPIALEGEGPTMAEIVSEGRG